MKDGLRFLGIDDGPREAEKLIGVSYRGTDFIEQVEIVDQKPDTGEATHKIIELYRCFNQDIASIFLDGISFNGFNIADIEKINQETGIPVIAVTPNEPDKKSVREGMETADLGSEIVDRLPQTHELGGIYIQFSGCSHTEAELLTSKVTLQGNIPEPVRVADLIGNAFQSP